MCEIMNDINNIIAKISNAIDDMTMNAFAVCGFDKDFVINNAKDFRRNVNIITNDSSYFYKNKFLFTVRVRFENDGMKNTVYVDFAKEYEALLDKFNSCEKIEQ